MSAAAIMVLVGQFFSRFNLVVSGQIIPSDHGFVDVPQYLSYTPTVAEYLLVVAGLGVVGFGFSIGERFFDETFRTSAHWGIFPAVAWALRKIKKMVCPILLDRPFFIGKDISANPDFSSAKATADAVELAAPQGHFFQGTSGEHFVTQ